MVVAVQKAADIKPTSRFFKGKMLMIAKVSPMSFIYNMIETIS